MQEYKNIDKLLKNIIEIKHVQFNSAEFNVFVETTEVWPMKGRAKMTKVQTQYRKTFNRSHTINICTWKSTQNTGSSAV